MTHDVFVTGATGVLGRRAVPALVSAGHRVTAVARGAEKEDQLRAAGASPITVDLFDPTAVRAAVEGHDVVCHLATHIPPTTRAWRAAAWATNDRLRREASRHLVDAALATGAERYVQESITFSYADGGDAWLDEGSPLAPNPVVASSLEAGAQADRFTAAGGTGVVLRFGLFYGPDSHHTTDTVAGVRRRFPHFPLGRPGSWISSVHLDDTGTAVAAALMAPPGAWNVVDDEPVTRRHYLESLSAAMGRGPVPYPGAVLARVAGRRAEVLARSQRVSNRRFRAATGWAPKVASVDQGWPLVVAALEREERSCAAG